MCVLYFVTGAPIIITASKLIRKMLTWRRLPPNYFWQLLIFVLGSDFLNWLIGRTLLRAGNVSPNSRSNTFGPGLLVIVINSLRRAVYEMEFDVWCILIFNIETENVTYLNNVIHFYSRICLGCCAYLSFFYNQRMPCSWSFVCGMLLTRLWMAGTGERNGCYLKIGDGI